MSLAHAQATANIVDAPSVKKEKVRDPASDTELAALRDTLTKAVVAQRKYSTYSQAQVDKIFKAAALAANQARIPLAKMAAEETRMGVAEDKVRRNAAMHAGCMHMHIRTAVLTSPPCTRVLV